LEKFDKKLKQNKPKTLKALYRSTSSGMQYCYYVGLKIKMQKKCRDGSAIENSYFIRTNLVFYLTAEFLGHLPMG
jgi:hypothetical protein